jgi:heptosyltransferase-2
MTRILILKTGALGDVLRTTSILPGLAKRFPDLRVTWVTAPAAKALVDRHPLVGRTLTVDPKDESAIAKLSLGLQLERFEWVLSLDDETPLCRLASESQARRVSGAFLDAGGERTYSEDVAEWFEMGLLSRLGKAEADRRKVKNKRSHPAIYADMFGIEMGAPELPLLESELSGAQAIIRRTGLAEQGVVIGLNTGAGGTLDLQNDAHGRGSSAHRELASFARWESALLDPRWGGGSGPE